MCLSVNCNVVKVHGLGRYTRLFSDSVASPECRAGMCCSATASVDTTALTPGGSLSHIQAATTENALQENAEPENQNRKTENQGNCENHNAIGLRVLCSCNLRECEPDLRV